MAVEDVDVTQDQEPPKGETPVERLFRYSAWVHLGPGAENCDDISEDPAQPKNDCSNPLHFHAWVRLPNQFQHDTIREKALAAKGRRARQLRDPSTDAHDALEEALDGEARKGEAARDQLVEELLDRTRWKDYAEAVRAVVDIDEDVEVEEGEDPPKLYGHIAADQQRFEELVIKAADDPGVLDGDEYKELDAHIKSYLDAVAAAHEEVVGPLKAELAELDINALIDRVREERIRKECNTHFMTVYHRWEWLYCTYRCPNDERIYASFEQLDAIAPEVYEALRATFDDLEQSQNMGVESGNS